MGETKRSRIIVAVSKSTTSGLALLHLSALAAVYRCAAFHQHCHVGHAVTIEMVSGQRLWKTGIIQ